MTRAKEELYLCHAGLREFRGMARYAIASQFLSQLPPEGVDLIDLSEDHKQTADEWRGGSPAAEDAWHETGIGGRLPKVEMGRQGDKETRRHAMQEGNNGEATKVYADGRLVRHDIYGQGRITQVS